MPFNPTLRSTKDFATSWVSLWSGATDAGKTTLLRDCELIINTMGEDGLASLSHLDVPVADVDHNAKPMEIIQWLMTRKETVIGIDSFGWLINKLFLKQVLGSRTTRTWGDWDTLGDWTDDFITELKKLNKDIFCTAMEQLVRNDLSGITKGYPDIGTRNYQQTVSARFDISAHVSSRITSGKKTITVDLADAGMWTARIRTPMREGVIYSFDATEKSALDIHRELQSTINKETL